MVSIVHWLILLIPVLLLGLVIWLFVRRRSDPPVAGDSARVTRGTADPPADERP